MGGKRDSGFTSTLYIITRGNLKAIGFAVILNGSIVSGASSYTIYKDGIEIEIDTKKEFPFISAPHLCKVIFCKLHPH